MGRGGAGGWGLRSHPAWFCLATFLPSMTGKTFLPHPCPLGPRKALPHPVKLYFLLICLTTSTIFLMKPISLIIGFIKKIILKIITKFIPSNQINF